jgi:hypothetical protein
MSSEKINLSEDQHPIFKSKREAVQMGYASDSTTSESEEDSDFTDEGDVTFQSDLDRVKKIEDKIIKQNNKYREDEISKNNNYYLFIQSISKSTADNLLSQFTAGGIKCQLFPDHRIRLKMSLQEKTEKKQAYREQYRNKPENIEKRKKQAEDPEVKQKRKEYSQRPDVKERKRLVSKANREFLNQAKQNLHKHWVDYKKDKIPPIERKKKAKAPKTNKRKRSDNENPDEIENKQKKIKLVSSLTHALDDCLPGNCNHFK